MQNAVGQPQTVQVPNYSGVNIQIFNPSVNAPGATPAAQNINAPTYSTNPAQAYPPNYYVQNLAQPAQAVQQPSKAAEPEKKKTEKRDVVELTDDYIKNLENYLNSQDAKIRLMGAKEVLARLQEDDSRKDDVALNALVNKMLQDPSQQVKFISMAILDSRIATGNELTVKLLQNIQQQKTGYGEDALKASQILLKMAGNTVQKEFEVKESKKEKSANKKSESKEA